MEFTPDPLIEAMTRGDAEPGGGTLAATTAALAAGLCQKLARRSRVCWSEAGGAEAQAETLARRLGDVLRANATAHERALAALDGRDASPLAEALARAAEMPLALAEACADVAALAETVAHRCEPGLRPDAATAALLAQAASTAAAHLVEVNLAVHADDRRAARARRTAAAARAAGSRALEDSP
jgi:formiminotetrahydrofolate cyclodeaminase